MEGPVGRSDAQLGVEDQQRLPDGLDDRFGIDPRLVDRVRRLLALGDVDEGDDDAGDAVVLRAVGEHASQVPPADVAPHFGLNADQLVEHRRGIA